MTTRLAQGLRPKVFLGLSGGVDSAVSAALLKRAGFDVTGVFIKVWTPDFLECNWREERRDAIRVALDLNIPFLFFDFEEEYKREVADYMISEYKAGRTPNPDVLCNRAIKFGAFWQKAKEHGADYIATGHYAQNLEKGTSGHLLLKGTDTEKDQSYFLWTLVQEDLEHALFPIGHLKKSEVRKLAKDLKLPVAQKKDSQGICFLGDISLEDFLSHYSVVKPGNVLNTRGEVIGRHKGALYYTHGQRQGFEVTTKKPEDGAYYVVSKDMRANTITVSNNTQEISALSPKKVVLDKVNWIIEPEGPEVMARTRYRGELVRATLGLEGRRLTLTFDKPQRALSLGQSVVFYKDEIVLGGAVMDRVAG
jgi:tRNA-uridine 2-sulfurtransferase